MIRFFAAPSDVSGGFIRLSAEDGAHVRSLRLRPDELFVVCDGCGVDYLCRLGPAEATIGKMGKEKGEREKETSEKRGKGDAVSGLPRRDTPCNDEGLDILGLKSSGNTGTIAEIVEKRKSIGEPSVKCSVFIAYAKGDRLDYAVQKSVELGAYEVVLFPSERCISIPGDVQKKTARFQRIALETAKQCGRGIVPVVSAEGSFKAAVGRAVSVARAAAAVAECATAAAVGLPLFFYECEERQRLSALLDDVSIEAVKGKTLDHEMTGNNYPAISIVTGPEGGFEPHEAEYAKSAGMLTVSLGPRILRCETAPIAALAAVMYHTGNM